MATSRQFISRAEAQAPFYVGFDLGGTNMKAGVVDDLGRPLSWQSEQTQVELGPHSGAERIAKLIGDVVAAAGLQMADIARVGLASPGTMDIPAGMLLEPPNLVGWEQFPLVAEVQKHCPLPLTFANDANAAAYGEFWLGAGREFSSMVLLTLGTGVGGGIIIDDFTIDGENSHGGEVGHIIIDYQEDARLCSCHKRGHLEAYASATALMQRAEEALDSGRVSSLAERRRGGEQVTPLVMNEEAGRGDALSLELILETAMYLGVGVVTLIHTIDPSGVVLGGAMNFGGEKTEIGRKFLARVQEEVHRRAFPRPAERVKIEYAQLGGDAGYIGAAGLARVAHRKSLPA